VVQVVENRTDLEGVVLSRAPDPERPGYDVVDIDVRRATPVEGYADLLSSRVGSHLGVHFKRDLLPGGRLEGAAIRCRAFLAGPGVVMAESRAGNLSVTPPA
jgi:hypothetical protein